MVFVIFDGPCSPLLNTFSQNQDSKLGIPITHFILTVHIDFGPKISALLIRTDEFISEYRSQRARADNSNSQNYGLKTWTRIFSLHFRVSDYRFLQGKACGKMFDRASFSKFGRIRVKKKKQPVFHIGFLWKNELARSPIPPELHSFFFVRSWVKKHPIIIR